MKIKNTKIIGVLLTLVLLASLTAGLAVPAAAQGPQNVWSTIPAVGDLGPMATCAGPPGSTGAVAGPGPMEKAIDGTIYAYLDKGPVPAPAPSNLVKSPNGGHTWMPCSTPTDDLPWLDSSGATVPLGDDGFIIAIACSAEDANTLYVAAWLDVNANGVRNAGEDQVYRSSDAGATFALLSAIPAPNGFITSLTVGYSGGTHWIIVGTNNAFSGTDGEVYMKSDLFGSLWNAQGLAGVQTIAGNYSVLAVAASPNFTTEANPQVVAVVSSAANTYASFQYGGGAWNSASTPDVELQYDPVPTSFGGVFAADIAFPDDYNSAYSSIDLLVAIDDWPGIGGDVYRVYPTIAYDQDIGGANTTNSVNSVAVTGNSGSTKVLAAGFTSNNVWHSENDSLSWLPCLKTLVCTTANTMKYIVMDDSYATNGTALVGVASWVGYDESSAAQTTDFGVSWTDIGCIDTNVNQIMNMDVSSAYSTDNTMFLITSSGGVTPADSLWKFDGTFWTRVLAIPAGNAGNCSVQCSPNYTVDNAVFMLDETTAGAVAVPPYPATPKIFRATDGGTWFLPQVGAPGVPPGTMIAGDGTYAWKVIDSSHLVVGDTARIFYTHNNGTTFIPSDPLPGPPNTVVSFALSADGSTMLAGGNGGGLYKSGDAGASWGGAAPPSVTGLPGTAWSNVAFDPNDPMTIYAADSFNGAVYRLTFPGDTMWRRIDGLPIVTWPGASTAAGALNANALVPGMQVAPDGALYAADAFAIGGGGGGADSFTITATGAGNATLTVATGSVMVSTATAGVTFGANVGPFTNIPVVASMLPIAYPIGFPGAGTITVVSTSTGTTGSWNLLGGPLTAATTGNGDGDEYVGVAGGGFGLPDSAVTAATPGAANVVLRSINPLAPTNTPFGPYFEPMATGFTGVVANAVGVWYVPGSNKLLVLESAPAPGTSTVWVYDDSLSVPVNLSDPADGTDTGRTSTALLSWSGLPDCPEYEIWVAPNPAFSPVLINGFSNTTSFMATGLEDGITYYWRVCSAASNAGTPGRALSPWSADWSFTTGLAAAEWNPFSDAENVAPVPGATGVPLSPAFQWNPADWATGYEFVLADNPAFTAPLAEETVTAPVYLYSGTLAYSTTYYWKVRAVSATSESVWATGTFTTMAPPITPETTEIVVPPATVEEITPAWIWAIVIIGAILVIAVIVLIVVTRRVP